tara:strand:- start:50 stop:1009 length:960 start_codon:yes stop_codon:yes gene_type:complete
MFDYNFLQKTLHTIVLGSKFINKSLFEIEKIFFLEEKNIQDKKHIFISGLPRSGTTLLLNVLYESGEFASLKYSNMPFILSPNISNLIPRKNIPKKERYHNDGIYFDLKSPEAFDEIFFKVFVFEEDFHEFKNFVELILKSQSKSRYLSKNNLNFKRIKNLSSLFPNSRFLIPIREPYQHSISLQKQHKNFLNLQNKNSFVRKYMNYLGHSEFGIDHKSWNEPIKYDDTNNINYWLEQWFIFYEKIYEKYFNFNSCNFVIYDEFYKEDNFKNLINKLEINNLNYSSFFKTKDRYEITPTLDINLYKKSLSLYNEFKRET